MRRWEGEKTEDEGNENWSDDLNLPPEMCQVGVSHQPVCFSKQNGPYDSF